MRVTIDCPGCESKLRKSLQKLDEVIKLSNGSFKFHIFIAIWQAELTYIASDFGLMEYLNLSEDQKLRQRRVDNVDIDLIMQKVTVTGYVNQEKVLRRARRNGRHAELWPFPYNPEYHDFNQHYPDQIQYQLQSPPTTYSITEIPSSYNYYEHGYNGHEHGYYQQPVYSTIIDEQTSEYFSDENSNACSIM
ncbi:hypothetical protein RJ640_017335 [Escallonia rubra]|uniref:HMA domain-containing protein n=1 Tax=Escallonia rubra TaxID=112253 RepID=A0AA88U3Y9_9ASTE|nr:hypothetical protein RJ640_017335 [Escallonia rubra]